MADFEAISGEFDVNSATLGRQADPSVAAIGNGFFVAWEDAVTSDIRATVIQLDGSPISPDFGVNTTTTGAQFDPYVAAADPHGADNSVLVSWTDTSGADGDTSGTQVRGRIIDLNPPSAADFWMSATTAGDQRTASATALNGGRIFAVWEDTSGTGSTANDPQIHGAFLQGDGTASADFTVNTTAVGAQSVPVTAALTGGDLAVVWRSNTDSIIGRVLDPNGDPAFQPAEFRIDRANTSAQGDPAIAALRNGTFVVVWRDTGGAAGDPGSHIRGQIVAADGSKLGASFLVNTASGLDEQAPVVAALPDGGFAVAWQEGNFGTGEIRARVMQADGSSSEPVLQVNTTTALDQTLPSIAVLRTGEFMVAWQDDSSQALSGEIRARIYAPVDTTPEDAPPETADAAGTGEEDAGRVAVHLTGSDPDGAIAAFRLGPLPPGALFLTETGGNSVAETGQTYTVTASNDQATVWFDANANFNGTLTFDVVAIDDGGLADGTPAVVTLTIAEVNDAPMAHSPRIEIDEDQPLDYPAATLFNVVDLDGDLTYAELVAGPAHADGFVLREDGSFSYRPASDFSGEDGFTYRATDRRGGVALGTVTIIVNPVDDTGETWVGRATADTHSGTPLNDTLSGLGGNDNLRGLAGGDVIDGGDGSDALRGGSGSDTLAGGNGNDALDGETGDDLLDGGAGNDALRGGDGTDVLNGGSGADAALGGADDDQIAGAAGNDVLDGDEGDDTLDGGDGADNLAGGEGNDTLAGGAVNDVLDGDQGDDIVDGGDDADRVEGGAGNDDLRGGNGADTLVAGSGSDILFAAAGADRIDLADGSAPERDTVRYTTASDSGPAAARRDIVAGFNPGEAGTSDRIDLSAVDARPDEAGDQAFVFATAFTALAGEIRLTASDGDTLVHVDTDSDAADEMTILIAGAIGLTVGDFIL